MRKPCYYNKILAALKQLHECHPTYPMGRHLSTAFDGYGDLWNVTDKEMLFAIEKYAAELAYDIPHPDDIDNILKDGMNLTIEDFEDGEDY